MTSVVQITGATPAKSRNAPAASAVLLAGVAPVM